MQESDAPLDPQPPPWRRAIAAVTRFVDEAEGRFLRAPRPASVAGRLLHALQVTTLAFRRHVEDHAGDRAAALTYSTLLSLLPLLLLGLAVMGLVGISPETSEQVRRWLYGQLLPEAAEGFAAELEHILLALEARSHALGVGGGALFLYAGWRLLDTLHRTFSQIWGTHRWRSYVGRVAGFWLAVAAAPLFIAASLYVSTRLPSVPLGLGIKSRPLLSFTTAWVAVFLIYLIFPGRRVRLSAAALGAAVQSLLWELLKLGFAYYVQHAFVTSTVLAGFGILPVFLVWLYFSWAALIYGAEVAYVAQEYPEALARSNLASLRRE